jgi:hypothetical protein
MTDLSLVTVDAAFDQLAGAQTFASPFDVMATSPAPHPPGQKRR